MESYGTDSRCIDHTAQMWEERSCAQVRQWQHWGSGCYRYLCASGRLHIVVLNHTFTCFYPNQEIEIALMDNGWLHTGSLVCPPCEDVCVRRKGVDVDHVDDLDDDFRCRPGVLQPKNFVYPRDALQCGGSASCLARGCTASLVLAAATSFLMTFLICQNRVISPLQ